MQEYLLQESYCKYLRNIRGLKESSVKHYLDAINYISKFLVKKGRINSTLFEIWDISELVLVKELLFNDVTFIDIDKRGHQMYSAGFNNYFRFANGVDMVGIDVISKLDTVISKPQKLETQVKTWNRSSIIKRQVLNAAEYKCEFDEAHLTFIAKSNGKPYMEGHHAIPMNRQDKFDNSLDVYANVICLCPICHRMLHYGENNVKETVLNKLYYKRADRLAVSGLKMSHDEFVNLAM